MQIIQMKAKMIMAYKENLTLWKQIEVKWSRSVVSDSLWPHEL